MGLFVLGELPLALTPEQVRVAEEVAEEVAEPPVREDSPQLVALAEADTAWRAGDRRTAVLAWRDLLSRVEASPEGDALELMVRVRLLPLAGTIGPLWLEAPLRAAVSRCDDVIADTPASGASMGTVADWCRVAEADYDIWMPRIAGADPRRVPADLQALSGWAPADERIAQANALAAARSGQAGPVAQAERAAQAGQPPDSPNPWPGTWVLGWGVSVAPGLGAGLGLHFVHPDLRYEGHRLSLDGRVDSLGGFAVSSSFAERASRRSLVARASGGNLRGVVWGNGRGTDAEAAAYTWQTAQAAAGFASTRGDWVLSGGGEGRWDHAVTSDQAVDASGGFGVGPWARATWSGPVRLSLAAEVTGQQAGPAFALGSFDVRKGIAVGEDRQMKVVGRLLGEVSTDGPFYRLPSAGGATLLRGAYTGRYRGPFLAAAQIELRRQMFGALQGALFADGAWVSDWGSAVTLDDLHVSAGGGVRLVLPPSDLNVTRLDVGFVPTADGTVTWGLVIAWGQAF